MKNKAQPKKDEQNSTDPSLKVFKDALHKTLRNLPIPNRKPLIQALKGSEYKEFEQYCIEARAMIGVDIRQMLPFIDENIHYAYIKFSKGDFSIQLMFSSFLSSKTLETEFETPKGTRKFTLYSEDKPLF